jgi:hypothetical protein
MLRLRKKQTHLDSIEAYACLCRCPTANCWYCNCVCIPPGYRQTDFDSEHSEQYAILENADVQAFEQI